MTRDLGPLLAAIAEGAAERERTGERPFAAFALLRDARVGALRVPVADGGDGATLRELLQFVVDLAAADPNVAQALRAHFGAVEEQLLAPDGPARRRWLARYAEGELVGNANTDTGARPIGEARRTTLLEPEGDGWRLTGEKRYCTGTLYSDWVLVTASTPDDRPAVAIVPTDRDGVTVQDDWDGFGQRLTGTGTTRFDRVAVAPQEATVFPPVADAPRWPMSPFFQHYLNAVQAGIARAVRDDAIALLRDRARSFTHAAAARPREDPIFLETIGELSAAATAAEAIVLAGADALAAIADAVHAGAPTDPAVHAAALEVSAAQTAVDALVLEAATALFDVAGASATRVGPNLDRHWRNARTIASHNPPRLKDLAVGAHLVHGTPLPDNTFF